MLNRIYWHLHDVLQCSANRGNIRYIDVCKAFRGEVTQLGVLNALKILHEEGKVYAETYFSYAYVQILSDFGL